VCSAYLLGGGCGICALGLLGLWDMIGCLRFDWELLTMGEISNAVGREGPEHSASLYVDLHYL
jgi:hypothetical protein